MTVKSAIINNEVFLQGEFLSIGINRDGSLGTRAAAPTGFNSDVDSGFLRVGMYADLDGFGRNPGNLRARLYVPASVHERPALVVVLHGCTQNAAGYDVGAGWSRLSMVG